MDISVAPALNRAEWTKNLEEFNYSLFIIPEWIESLKTHQLQPIYLDFQDNNGVVAKISGFRSDHKRSFLRKMTFYAGPALRKGMPESLIKNCIAALAEYAKKQGYSRIVVLSYDFPYIVDLKINGYGSVKRSEYYIDLTQDEKAIMQGFSNNVKRNITKAKKNEFTFRESDSPSLTVRLIELLEETRKIRLSKGYKDYNYFYFPGFTIASLNKLIESGVIKFFLIEKTDIIYGIHVVLARKTKAYGLFIGFSPEGYINSIPSFLESATLFSLKNNGYEYFNFGGVPTDETHLGISDFKRRLGAVRKYSSYGSTNFLIPPFTILNPAVNILRTYSDTIIINKIKELLKF